VRNWPPRSGSSSKSNRSAYAVKYANANKTTCVATLTHGRRRATRSPRSLLTELVAIKLYLYRGSPQQTSDRRVSASSLLAPCQAACDRVCWAIPNRRLAEVRPGTNNPVYAASNTLASFNRLLGHCNHTAENVQTKKAKVTDGVRRVDMSPCCRWLQC